MHLKLDEDFLYRVCAIVNEIPYGYVATYGQIARLAGCDKNSRLVGKALSLSFMCGNYPCHRVVNVNGRVTPGWKEQKDLLINEGVLFKNENCVDLRKHRWNV